MSERRKRLTPEQRYMVNQIVATLRISGMEPSGDCIEELERIASGEKTVEQSIKEIITKYQQ